MWKPSRENNFSISLKLEILNKTDGNCWYCGVVLTSSKSFHGENGKTAFTVDHFHNNGGDDISNLVPACRDCNNRKKGKHVEAFRLTESTRRGRIFSEAQREYWKAQDIQLPIDQPFCFYFETL